MSSQSRRVILDRLRSQGVESVPLPDVVHGDWIRYADPISQLGSVVQMVGGSFEIHPDAAAVGRRLGEFPEYQQATKILSCVAEIPGTVDLGSIDHPSDLEDLDFVVVTGELAVAENGAVWVTDLALKHRVAYFINQHLVMIVRRSSVVHNMHEAYARITLGARMFGCFISGPSKTADIEQSLVIGAHGCRSMQMYLVDRL